MSFQRFCLLKNLLDILCAHNYLVCSYAVRRMNGSIQIKFKSYINPGNMFKIIQLLQFAPISSWKHSIHTYKNISGFSFNKTISHFDSFFSYELSFSTCLPTHYVMTSELGKHSFHTRYYLSKYIYNHVRCKPLSNK